MKMDHGASKEVAKKLPMQLLLSPTSTLSPLSRRSPVKLNPQFLEDGNISDQSMLSMMLN